MEHVNTYKRSMAKLKEENKKLKQMLEGEKQNFARCQQEHATSMRQGKSQIKSQVEKAIHDSRVKVERENCREWEDKLTALRKSLESEMRQVLRERGDEISKLKSTFQRERQDLQSQIIELKQLQRSNTNTSLQNTNQKVADIRKCTKCTSSVKELEKVKLKCSKLVAQLEVCSKQEKHQAAELSKVESECKHRVKEVECQCRKEVVKLMGELKERGRQLEQVERRYNAAANSSAEQQASSFSRIECRCKSGAARFATIPLRSEKLTAQRRKVIMSSRHTQTHAECSKSTNTAIMTQTDEEITVRLPSCSRASQTEAETIVLAETSNSKSANEICQDNTSTLSTTTADTDGHTNLPVHDQHKQHSMDALSKEVCHLEACNSKLQKNLTEVKEQNDLLEFQLLEAESTAANLARKSKNTITRPSSADGCVSISRNGGLDKELKERYERKIVELRNALDSLISKGGTGNAALEQKAKECKLAKKVLVRLEREVVRLQEHVSALEGINDNLRGQLSVFSAEWWGNTNTAAEHNDDSQNTLPAQHITPTSNGEVTVLDELKDKIFVQEQELFTLEALVSRREQEACSAREEAARVSEERDALQRRCRDVRELRAEVTRWETRCRTLELGVEDAQHHIQRYESKYERLKAEKLSLLRKLHMMESSSSGGSGSEDDGRVHEEDDNESCTESQRCFVLDPAKRISINEALTHPFIQDRV